MNITLNDKNLLVAPFRGKSSIRPELSGIVVTENICYSTDSYTLLSVSLPEKQSIGKTQQILKTDNIPTLKKDQTINTQSIERIDGEAPTFEGIQQIANSAENTMTIVVNPEYLKKIATALTKFVGKHKHKGIKMVIDRDDFNKSIKFEAENPDTTQEVMGLLMPIRQ